MLSRTGLDGIEFVEGKCSVDPDERVRFRCLTDTVTIMVYARGREKHFRNVYLPREEFRQMAASILAQMEGPTNETP